MFEPLRRKGYDLLTLHHAEAILSLDMPGAAEEIVEVLENFEIQIEELVSGGGGEAPLTQRIRNDLTARGWIKRNITIRKLIGMQGSEERETQSLSHEIDHVKQFGNHHALLEIEWNNKDPFYDRDLENFQRLHAEGMASLGIIITRGRSLHENLRALLTRFAVRDAIDNIDDLAPFDYTPTARQRQLIEARAARSGNFAEGWAQVFVSDKYGEATTHWKKLEDRVRRGVGNPCPLLLIGIPDTVIRI